MILYAIQQLSLVWKIVLPLNLRTWFSFWIISVSAKTLPNSLYTHFFYIATLFLSDLANYSLCSYYLYISGNNKLIFNKLNWPVTATNQLTINLNFTVWAFSLMSHIFEYQNDVIHIRSILNSRIPGHLVQLQWSWPVATCPAFQF